MLVVSVSSCSPCIHCHPSWQFKYAAMSVMILCLSSPRSSRGSTSDSTYKHIVAAFWFIVHSTHTWHYSLSCTVVHKLNCTLPTNTLLQQPDSEFIVHTHSTIHCHVLSIIWTALTSQHLWEWTACGAFSQQLLMSSELSSSHCHFVTNVSTMFRHKIQIFLIRAQRQAFVNFSTVMFAMNCVHVSKGRFTSDRHSALQLS